MSNPSTQAGRAFEDYLASSTPHSTLSNSHSHPPAPRLSPAGSSGGNAQTTPPHNQAHAHAHAPAYPGTQPKGSLSRLLSDPKEELVLHQVPGQGRERGDTERSDRERSDRGERDTGRGKWSYSHLARGLEDYSPLPRDRVDGDLDERERERERERRFPTLEEMGVRRGSPTRPLPHSHSQPQSHGHPNPNAYPHAQASTVRPYLGNPADDYGGITYNRIGREDEWVGAGLGEDYRRIDNRRFPSFSQGERERVGSGRYEEQHPSQSSSQNHLTPRTHHHHAQQPQPHYPTDEMSRVKRERLETLIRLKVANSPSLSQPHGTSPSSLAGKKYYGMHGRRERGRSFSPPPPLLHPPGGADFLAPRSEVVLPRVHQDSGYPGSSNGRNGLDVGPISRPGSVLGGLSRNNSYELSVPVGQRGGLPDPRDEFAPRGMLGRENEEEMREREDGSPRAHMIVPTLPAVPVLSMPDGSPMRGQDEMSMSKKIKAKPTKPKMKGKRQEIDGMMVDSDDALNHGAKIEPDQMVDDDTPRLLDQIGQDSAENGSTEPDSVKQERAKEMSPETMKRWEQESWPTKGLLNKDGSLRRKPGPPKGVAKAPRKLAPAKRPEGNGTINGDGDFRQQALLNASGLGEGSIHGDTFSEDGSSVVDAIPPPTKPKKRKNRPIASRPVSRASSPADFISEAGSHPMSEVDNELEDILISQPSKPRVKDGLGPLDMNDYTTTQVTNSNHEQANHDPYDDDDDQEPEFEADLPEPEATQTPVPDILQYDQPGAVLTAEVARARHLKMEILRATIWKQIAMKEVPQVHKYVEVSITNRAENARKLSGIAVRQQKRWVQRPYATAKENQARGRKAARDAAAYWKRNEKDEIEQRKRAEKEAIEKAKAEEAAREKARAAKRLQFLLDSGETYSKLMMKKIRTDEAMDSPDTTVDPNTKGPATEDIEDVDSEEEVGDDDIEVNEDDHDPDVSDAVARKRAAARARAIMAKKKREAAAFDAQVQFERKAALVANGGGDLNEQLTSESLDFQNPLGAGVRSVVTQPKMLQAQLKEYQVKGLSWLAHLYENGINGILADEMGLGKTIQSISLLAWLAETQNIWGPFLVVAPTSTVHNWQQELARFVPKLKAIPYWGKPSDRQVLRRDWNRKSIVYTEDAPFHIVVTSYDMAVQDHTYFHKVRWQYMILDEAQAVKNASSLRWTTLLSLKTRNRLLLTGTPIQNSMNELWALLHFIMPDLFTSLTDFTEWFSKGIEGVAGKGDSTLGTQQLRRLHDVLRPFMLRRIKKNVQSELGEKIEKDILVDLSARQKVMYRMLRSDASIKAFLAQASATSDTASRTNTLLNIVMQFRKVCNHPDLFQRPDVVSPFSFGTFSSSGELIRQKELYCPDSCRNPIEVTVPRLLWEEGGILSRPGEKSHAGFDTKYLQNLFNIWSPHNRSWDTGRGARTITARSLFEEPDVNDLPPYYKRFKLPPTRTSPFDVVRDVSYGHFLTRREARFVVEDVVAPPIQASCSSRSFIVEQERKHLSETNRTALFGLPGSLADDEDVLDRARETIPELPPLGLIGNSSQDQQPLPSMAFPNVKRLMVDSAKLSRMDLLLRELKEGGHRVLVYFQMTKMMDLFEEFLVYRQHRYIRLDGSTQLGERRDLVNAWQTNPDIFVFMLSTRAGGLGINLTAADTVVFYEHDWNPSNDSQAMDRAHRVGQTRQVTVYRLICKGTVEERMLHLARNKKDVQDIVVGNKSVAEVNSSKEIVSMLLDDEDDTGALAGGFARNHGMATGGLGNPLGGDDDDDFFGSSVSKKNTSKELGVANLEEDNTDKKPAKKAKKRKTTGPEDEDPEAESKPKKSKKKKAAATEEGTPDVEGEPKPKAKRQRKPKAGTATPAVATEPSSALGTPLASGEPELTADAMMEEVL